MKTGRVHVARHVKYDDQIVVFYRQAVLLREGDRFALHDPAENNELARGMTRDFVTMLFQRGWLLWVKEVSL